jgi:hypothetical protein
MSVWVPLSAAKAERKSQVALNECLGPLSAAKAIQKSQVALNECLGPLSAAKAERSHR